MTAYRIRQNRSGFSLIEVAVATVILAVGITALMSCLGSGTVANDEGAKLTQAVFLAQELREWTLNLPFSDPDPADANNPPGPDGSDPNSFVDDLDDLMAATFTAPRDATGSPIADMAGWTETINITWLSTDDLSTTVTAGTSDIVSVTTAINYSGKQVLQTQWLVSRR